TTRACWQPTRARGRLARACCHLDKEGAKPNLAGIIFCLLPSFQGRRSQNVPCSAATASHLEEPSISKAHEHLGRIGRVLPRHLTKLEVIDVSGVPGMDERELLGFRPIIPNGKEPSPIVIGQQVCAMQLQRELISLCS